MYKSNILSRFHRSFYDVTFYKYFELTFQFDSISIYYHVSLKSSDKNFETHSAKNAKHKDHVLGRHVAQYGRIYTDEIRE